MALVLPPTRQLSQSQRLGLHPVLQVKASGGYNRYSLTYTILPSPPPAPCQQCPFHLLTQGAWAGHGPLLGAAWSCAGPLLQTPFPVLPLPILSPFLMAV